MMKNAWYILDSSGQKLPATTMVITIYYTCCDLSQHKDVHVNVHSASKHLFIYSACYCYLKTSKVCG